MNGPVVDLDFVIMFTSRTVKRFEEIKRRVADIFRLLESIELRDPEMDVVANGLLRSPPHWVEIGVRISEFLGVGQRNEIPKRVLILIEWLES